MGWSELRRWWCLAAAALARPWPCRWRGRTRLARQVGCSVHCWCTVQLMLALVLDCRLPRLRKDGSTSARVLCGAVRIAAGQLAACFAWRAVAAGAVLLHVCGSVAGGPPCCTASTTAKWSAWCCKRSCDCLLRTSPCHPHLHLFSDKTIWPNWPPSTWCVA